MWNIITGYEVKHIEKVLPIAPWTILNLYGKKTEQNQYQSIKRTKQNKNVWTESFVGVEGAQKISELLKNNTALTALYLSGDRWDVMIEKNRKNEMKMKWKKNR